MRLTRRGLSLFVVLLTLLVALFAIGCSDDGPSEQSTPTVVVLETSPLPEPTATVTPKPQRTPVAPVATPFPTDMQEQALQILNRVAELRGSPPKGDVEMYLVSRQAAIDYYRGDGTDEDDEEDMDLQQEVYRLLGLIPETSDLQETFVNVLGAGITGFYEPRLDAFYLLDDLGGLSSASSRSTIVHELVHALQDQYFDLDEVSERIGEDWDAQRAFSSVVEGDAVTTEGLFAGRALGMVQRGACFTVPPANFGSTPYVVTRDLNSWYNDGSCFVQQVLMTQGGSPGAVFDRLPTTTEQLLHPEKYVANEGAKTVAVTDLTSTTLRNGASMARALGEGWTKGEQSNFGEYGLQNILMLGLSGNRPGVQVATAGWGGDRWQIYRNGEQKLLQAQTLWDSEDEARQFWDALFTSLLRSGSTVTRSGGPADGSFAGAVGGREWRGAWRGDAVVFVVATDAAAADSALEAIKP